MKKILCIISYSIVLLLLSAFTTPLILRITPSITLEQQNYLDTFIFILTLIVAVIAVLFAIIGIYEFSQIERIKTKLSSFESRMNEIKNVMAIHNQSMQQINEFLYKSSLRIAENTDSLDLLEEATLHYHIATLYCSNFCSDDSDSSIDKDAAFDYIQQKGSPGVIRYLEYIANHDTDKNNRHRALKVIGSIEKANSIRNK